MKCLDVCRLYPWACKYVKFPVGHSTILYGDNCPQTLDDIEGIAKETMLSPNNLYHPVLPYKVLQKLYFLLSWVRVETLNHNECNNTPEQRCITGT